MRMLILDSFENSPILNIGPSAYMRIFELTIMVSPATV